MPARSNMYLGVARAWAPAGAGRLERMVRPRQEWLESISPFLQTSALLNSALASCVLPILRVVVACGRVLLACFTVNRADYNGGHN